MISGPLGNQTANVANDAPLKTMLAAYRRMWSKKLVPVDDQTQDGLTWGDDFEAGKVGILPGDYGFATEVHDHGPEGRVRGRAAARRHRRQLQHLRRRRRLRDPGRGHEPSGAWEFIKWVLEPAQQEQYPSLGDTPVRTDILTPAFAAKNPYDAVALKALAKGSVEYTLAYDAVYNEPGRPGSRCSKTRFTAGTCPEASGRADRHPVARWTA